MTHLVLTRRPVLPNLADWLGAESERTVVVTTAIPKAMTALVGRFAAVEAVRSYNDASVGELLVRLVRTHRVRHIALLNEVDVLRAAAVRALFGLPGQDLSGAVAFRDKHLMKAAAAQAGVPIAPMRLVADKQSVRQAGRETGYPAILKPLDGGGSVGVHRLMSVEDVDRFEMSGRMLLEKEMQGGFVIVDGLMARGRVTQRVVLKMVSAQLPFLEGKVPIAGCSVCEGTPLAEAAVEFAQRVVAGLPPSPFETAFHLEAFVQDDGRLVLCEIAARPGGVGHAGTFADVTGLDLRGSSIRGQLGIAESGPTTRRIGEGGFAYYPRQSGRLIRHPSAMRHQLVTAYRPKMEVGEASTIAQRVGDSVAELHFAGPPGMDLSAALRDIDREYLAATEWEAMP